MGYFQQELEHWVTEKKNPPSPKKEKINRAVQEQSNYGRRPTKKFEDESGGKTKQTNKQTKKFEDESGTNIKQTLLWSYCQQKLYFWLHNYYSNEVKHKNNPLPPLLQKRKLMDASSSAIQCGKTSDMERVLFWI